MKLGFSLSPGGLLLPYHLGVLDGLSSKNVLKETSPLAGSSAGAIAVVCHACGMDASAIVQVTAELSAECCSSTVDGRTSTSSRGLVKALRVQMQSRIEPVNFEQLQARPGLVGIAYRELFPQLRPILQTEFQSVEDLTEAVCHSSTFPFFSSPYPFAIDTRGSIPRLVVDGFFTVPRERFGCPDFEHAVVEMTADDDDEKDKSTVPVVDRTICVSCFPQKPFGLTAVPDRDCISPSVDEERMETQIQDLMLAATVPVETGLSQYMQFYENGFRDAEAWVAREIEESWSLPPTNDGNEGVYSISGTPLLN